MGDFVTNSIREIRLLQAEANAIRNLTVDSLTNTVMQRTAISMAEGGNPRGFNRDYRTLREKVRAVVAEEFVV